MSGDEAIADEDSLQGPAEDGRPRAPVSYWLAPLLGAVTALGPLSIDMYLPAFPQISAELPAPAGMVEYTLVAFLLGAGLSQLVYGPLSDRFGRRKPLMIGCILFALGALGCAVARSMEWLIAGRLVQALGGGAGMVLARAVVRDRCHTREAARLYAMLMLIVGLAPILAPWLGGQLLVIGNWRLIFLVLAGCGLGCFLLCTAWLDESLPLARRNHGGVRTVVRNYWSVVRDGRFAVFATIAGCQTGLIFAYVASAPTVFIELHGVSPQQFGYFFGINAIALMCGTQSNRLLLKRFEPQQILAVALGIVASASVALLAAAWSQTGGLAGVAVPIFACLFGVGLAGPNLMSLALAPFPDRAGVASALLGLSQFGVGGLSAALVGLAQNGTALPMGAIMAGFSLLAATALTAALRRSVVLDPTPLPEAAACGE